MKELSVTDRQQEKMDALRAALEELGSVAVAFSGGVDSTFLLKTAHDVLGEKCVAVTARSCSFPERELREAEQFCREEGIRQIIVDFDEMEVEGFSSNPPDRCYLCKKELFKTILSIAEQEGAAVVEGSNTDDDGDYRPGMKAIRELGIKSPLKSCGLSKQDIRDLSRGMGLKTWDKPSFACLASRFVYGETITKEKLAMVSRAEQLLLDLGLRQVRVRIHGMMARIEAPAADLGKILENRETITEEFRRAGFTYVTMDLEGYRTGSMNETLRADGSAGI